MPSSPPYFSAILLRALSFIYVVVFFGFFPFAIIQTPYGDSLAWLDSFYNTEGNFWQYLLAPHNGHRIVFSKLFTIMDAQLFGGRSYPIALMCLMFLVCVATAVLVGIRRQDAPRESQQWITAIALFILFSTLTFPDYAYPPNSQFIFCVAFSFFACVVWTLAGEPNKNNPLRGRFYFYLFVTLVLALAASLSSLNGLLVWPLLAWIAWARSYTLRYVIAMLAAGGMVASYFINRSNSSPEMSFSALNPADIVTMLKYFVEFHGLPWMDNGTLYWPATAIGLALVLSSIALAIRSHRRARALAPAYVVAATMLFYSLGTATMITLGRYKLGLLPAHRYSIFVQVTYIALLFLCIPAITRWMAKHARPALWNWGMVIIGSALLAQQIAAGYFALKRANTFAKYEQHILTGGYDPEAATAIYFSDPGRIEDFYRLLKEHEIYMFRRK